MYSFDYDAASALEELLAFDILESLPLMMPRIISVVAYVFTALSLYTIAKRRGIRNPWLAWIPVADVWVFGSLSDQYRYVVKREIKSKRKALLPLCIVSGILSTVVFVLVFILLVAALAFSMGSSSMASMLEQMAPLPTILVVLSLPCAGTLVAYAILYYKALYDVYTSCDPGNRVAYLVLSILFSFTKPVFLFICRNKDNGMPPRRSESVNDTPQQPAWQPTAPAQEPWEQKNRDYL